MACAFGAGKPGLGAVLPEAAPGPALAPPVVPANGAPELAGAAAPGCELPGLRALSAEGFNLAVCSPILDAGIIGLGACAPDACAEAVGVAGLAEAAADLSPAIRSSNKLSISEDMSP